MGGLPDCGSFEDVLGARHDDAASNRQSNSVAGDAGQAEAIQDALWLGGGFGLQLRVGLDRLHGFDDLLSISVIVIGRVQTNTSRGGMLPSALLKASAERPATLVV